MSEQLQAVEDRIALVENELKSLKQIIQQIRETKKTVEVTAPHINSEFEELKALLQTDNWPFAINPNLICDITSEQDKEDRAEGILDIIIDVHMEGLKFLDFGCGEGHVVKRSKLQNTELSLGFDIKESPRWADFTGEKTIFTSDWNEVVKNGPYDVILIYDVIDHIVNDDPADVLKRLRPLLRNRAFVRCHPFCSRHATHLYHKLNKAYVHLVFREEELEQMGLMADQKVVKIIHPKITYNDLFIKAGFRLAQQPQIQKDPVEPFFVNNHLVATRIKANWVNSHDHGLRTGITFPFLQMEQQFADYILL